MSADAFEKTSLGWQVRQLQQQIGEWVELQLSQTRRHLPDWALPDWLTELSIPPLLLRIVFWVIVGLLLTWIFSQLWDLWGASIRSLGGRLQKQAPSSTIAQASQYKVSEWQKRSQDFYRQGNYKEASRCLYLATLQQLNDLGIAPHQPSRTDGEYGQLTQELPLRELYQTLLNTHEQLCFANAEISPALFERCQQAYKEISKYTVASEK